jgi:hypothetical protein
MIVLKPMFINADYEKIFDIELIQLEWRFILESLKTHCNDFEYNKAEGFKIWWWAVDDEDEGDGEEEIRRTCLLHIDTIEPTVQHINRFKQNFTERKMEQDHPRYTDEFDTLYLTFEAVDE